MATDKWRKENVELMRLYRRRWFDKNKEHARAKVMERKRELQEWLKTLKSTLKCSCGQDHIATLLFHHTDPSKKDIEISRAISNGWGRKRILKEMEKCDVLCSNCHTILHWEERQKNRSMV